MKESTFWSLALLLGLGMIGWGIREVYPPASWIWWGLVFAAYGAAGVYDADRSRKERDKAEQLHDDVRKAVDKQAGEQA